MAYHSRSDITVNNGQSLPYKHRFYFFKLKPLPQIGKTSHDDGERELYKGMKVTPIKGNNCEQALKALAKIRNGKMFKGRGGSGSYHDDVRERDRRQRIRLLLKRIAERGMLNRQDLLMCEESGKSKTKEISSGIPLDTVRAGRTVSQSEIGSKEDNNRDNAEDKDLGAFNSEQSKNDTTRRDNRTKAKVRKNKLREKSSENLYNKVLRNWRDELESIKESEMSSSAPSEKSPTDTPTCNSRNIEKEIKYEIVIMKDSQMNSKYRIETENDEENCEETSDTFANDDERRKSNSTTPKRTIVVTLPSLGVTLGQKMRRNKTTLETSKYQHVPGPSRTANSRHTQNLTNMVSDDGNARTDADATKLQRFTQNRRYSESQRYAHGTSLHRKGWHYSLGNVGNTRVTTMPGYTARALSPLSIVGICPDDLQSLASFSTVSEALTHKSLPQRVKPMVHPSRGRTPRAKDKGKENVRSSDNDFSLSDQSISTEMHSARKLLQRHTTQFGFYDRETTQEQRFYSENGETVSRSPTSDIVYARSFDHEDDVQRRNDDGSTFTETPHSLTEQMLEDDNENNEPENMIRATTTNQSCKDPVFPEELSSRTLKLMPEKTLHFSKADLGANVHNSKHYLQQLQQNKDKISKSKRNRNTWNHTRTRPRKVSIYACAMNPFLEIEGSAIKHSLKVENNTR